VHSQRRFVIRREPHEPETPAGHPRGRPLREQTLDYVARLLCAFPEPGDMLAAYVARPPLGGGLRRCLECLADAASGPAASPDIPLALAQAAARARRMLQWLDGEDEGSRDPFRVLGLSHSSTDEQIVRQYRELCKSVHPDRHDPGRNGYWQVRQSEISVAYATVSDPRRRAQWLQDHERRMELLQRLWQIERSGA